MKKYFFAFIVLAMAFAVQSTAQAQSKLRDSMIVSTEWLAKHVSDDSIVLLQVGDRKEYDAAHIPGAQYIQTSDISTPRGTGLILELPPVDQLRATFEKLGVTDKSRIVIYFSKDWVTPTSRVYFTLDYLGLGDQTSILDGGLPAWIAEKRTITAEIKPARPGSFTPHPNAKLVVDAGWVSGNINKPGVAILDARASKFYTGEDAGQMPRAGHIPSAKSIPFSTLIEDSNNKFKTADSLRALFSTAGVKTKDSIATYCHIGQQASLLYFVARYLGYDAHLYDGSFQDWSNRSDLPVEKLEVAKPDTKP
jgi:thiosulfate/3-mercaptopyruvate sulfurtransferase